MMSARLDYPPIVGIQRATAKSSAGHSAADTARAAAMEASKYSTKATDLLKLGDQLAEYNRQVKGLRLRASSQSLRPYIADSTIDEAELLDQGEVVLGQTIKATALWFEDVGEYLFNDLS